MLIALVPMKKSSERVPGKNIRNFAGKPLCCRILETLENCPVVDAVVLNTDSEEIAKLSLGHAKVTLHERPKELMGNDVSMNEIIAWDISHIPDDNAVFLQTHATNPLLTPASIEKALQAYLDGTALGYDSLFSVTPLQTRLYRNDGSPINHDPHKLMNTQELPIVYEENSNLYIFSRESFFKNRSRIGKKSLFFPMDKLEALDIDTESDFVLAETVYKLRHNVS